MKISRVFLDPSQTIKLLLSAMTQEEKAKLKAELGNPLYVPEENKPVGYSYCDEEDGLSATVFASTNRNGGGLFRTKKGDVCLNIKTKQAQKKGDHEANTPPEVAAEASSDAAAIEESPPQQPSHQDDQGLSQAELQEKWNQELMATL